MLVILLAILGIIDSAIRKNYITLMLYIAILGLGLRVVALEKKQRRLK